MEQTNKRWKAIQAIGLFGLVAVVPLWMVKDVIVAGIVGVLSLVVFFAGRAGAWWFHA